MLALTCEKKPPMSSSAVDAFGVYQPLIDAIAQVVAKDVRQMLEEKPPVRRRLLDAEQVGIIIGRTERAVLQAYHKGKIPGFKFLGKTTFDEADIHQWIEEEKAKWTELHALE